MYMDLSLGTLAQVTQEEHQEEEQEDDLYRRQQALLGQGSGGGGGGERASQALEQEHMFDKVLTPSDVGKLNRLVVPKQHAERFFPAAGAGTQLCFEDRGGVAWRFRYSYWGSSQSYVMTKGWSRFVRAARLAAGDTVSFSRAAAAAGRYFIEYRHHQRRHHRDISFGDAAAAAAMPAWPLVVGVHQQRTTPVVGGASATMAVETTTAPSSIAAGHDGIEAAGPSGARTFRLFGFNVECSCSVDDADAASASSEVEYADGDS